MIASVASVKGTCGKPKLGSAEGNWPRSATVRTWMPKTTVMTVSTTIATNGEGMALVR